jgi:hypothetical protein
MEYLATRDALSTEFFFSIRIPAHIKYRNKKLIGVFMNVNQRMATLIGSHYIYSITMECHLFAAFSEPTF